MRLKRADALTCESLMIGDNIEADIFGALESGFQLFYLIIIKCLPMVSKL